MKWIVLAPKDLEKTLKRLPREVGRLFEALVTDLENEGPFPKGWQVGHLSGEWKGYLKGSSQNKVYILALRLGLDLADLNEQNRRNSRGYFEAFAIEDRSKMTPKMRCLKLNFILA